MSLYIHVYITHICICTNIHILIYIHRSTITRTRRMPETSRARCSLLENRPTQIGLFLQKRPRKLWKLYKTLLLDICSIGTPAHVRQ